VERERKETGRLEAWSVFVCVLVTFMSPAKTAELIEIGSSQVGPINHVLDGGADAQGKRQFCGEKWQPIVKYGDTLP